MSPPAQSTADLDLSELVDVRIRVATGHPQPISRAPGAITVITADQILGMGVTHLDDLLETVAGVHVSPARVGIFEPRYTVRGIESNTAGAMLVLLNGIPIHRAAEGAPMLGLRLPVTGIERVEVIRGPGSAVYGAEAFGGVVDVITKRAEDIGGTRVGLRGGSFDTHSGWLQHGGRLGEWDLAVTLDVQTTDGDAGRVIASDRQAGLDALLGTAASLAPGPLATDSDLINLHLQAERAGWTARLWGFANDRGLGMGLAQALDPRGSQRSNLLMADLGYRTATSGGWELTQTLSAIHSDTDSDFNVFPPGAVLPIGADGNVDFVNPVAPVAFPEGLISRPYVEQTTVTFDSVARYQQLDRHDLRFNAGFARHEFDAFDMRNFGPGVIDGTEGVIDGTLTDLSGTEFAFSPDVSRNHTYLSLQDQWTPTDGLEVTIGARFDHFSDFGSTFNPRLALVWHARPRLSTKLLYGRAFRAPSFAQLFTTNNPSFLGNPDLDPETSETVEFVFDARPLPGLRTVLSTFYYETEELIEFVQDPAGTSLMAQNSGQHRGRGFELELSWEGSKGLRVDANYAWQRTKNRVPGRSDYATGGPRSQLYVGLDWRFRPSWRANLRALRVGARDRLGSDPRARLSGYTTVDLTLRRQRLLGRLDLALIGRNLFSSDGREPAEPVIPEDYPIEGRSVALEISFPLR